MYYSCALGTSEYLTVLAAVSRLFLSPVHFSMAESHPPEKPRFGMIGGEFGLLVAFTGTGGNSREGWVRSEVRCCVRAGLRSRVEHQFGVVFFNDSYLDVRVVAVLSFLSPPL